MYRGINSIYWVNAIPAITDVSLWNGNQVTIKVNALREPELEYKSVLVLRQAIASCGLKNRQ